MKRRFVRELSSGFREPPPRLPDSDPSESSDSEVSNRPRRRGRARIPEAWTRVIKVNQSQRQQIRIYAIETELRVQNQRREARQRLTVPEYVMLFWPKDWAHSVEFTSFDQFRLSDEQLLKFGIQVSKVRAAIRARSLRLTPAVPVHPPGEEPPLTALQRRIQLGHFTAESVKAKKRACYTIRDPTPPGARHKRRRRKLKLEEIVDIVHRVLIGKYKEADVAQLHGVTQPCVSRHVVAVRKRPELLAELLTK
jgi:hypothetical protein